MKGFPMTEAAVKAHNARHGFAGPKPAAAAAIVPVPKPRMNKTESAFALLLAAMKARGEILSYQFEGISLPWGYDPKTLRPMWYTPDFFVIRNAFRQNIYLADLVMIEVKGPHIFEKDWIRFKGCRSDWPLLNFELHQRRGGEWHRVA